MVFTKFVIVDLVMMKLVVVKLENENFVAAKFVNPVIMT